MHLTKKLKQHFKFLIKGKGPENYLYPGKNGGHQKTLDNVLDRIASKKNGVKVTPYQFRHTFATKLLKDTGGNIKAIQQALRHKNISTSSRYAWVLEADLKKAIDGLK